MVYLCNSIAFLNPSITTEIIEASEFPDLVARHVVGVTPKVVVNDTVEVVDLVPAAELIAKITAPPA